MPLVHHELCFGCGRTNVFGLLLEAEPDGQGGVAGRCFIKQDHQGARRGVAHDGVVSAALAEAMALACGPSARATALHTELTGSAPVGEFLEVTAGVGGDPAPIREATPPGSAPEATATATAAVQGVPIARARGTFTL